MSTLPTSEKKIAPRWSELATITSHRIATQNDSVEGVVPACVALPENAQQVSAILKWASANGVSVIARGGGTKLGWANLGLPAQLILSLEKLTRVADHAWQDMTVTVEAGTTIAALQAELAKHGQRLPLDALWPERSTVGGVIAANDSGSLRLRFGSARDLILGVTAVLADGTIAKSGGRVVKNVAGYDLPKLFTGSFGTLGVITEVTLRSYPLPHDTKTISFHFPDAEAANRYMLACADTTLVPAAMQMRLDPDVHVDLLFEGLSEGIAAQVERATLLAKSVETTDSRGAWQMRDRLCLPSENAVVLKFAVLPSALAQCAVLVQAAFPRCAMVVQSTGLGIARCEAPSQPLLQSLNNLRSQVEKIAGTLSVLSAPIAVKKHFDVFGATNSAYPLMVRLKQQFDPNGILSSGRFLGGI